MSASAHMTSDHWVSPSHYNPARMPYFAIHSRSYLGPQVQELPILVDPVANTCLAGTTVVLLRLLCTIATYTMPRNTVE